MRCLAMQARAQSWRDQSVTGCFSPARQLISPIFRPSMAHGKADFEPPTRLQLS